jgi:hypothetical protein
MRFLFSSVLTAAILIGGEMVVRPQVAVQVVVPAVVVPQVGFPEEVVPQVVVPFPVFGGFDERGRDVRDYGRRGHESRGAAHSARGGARGGRR